MADGSRRQNRARVTEVLETMEWVGPPKPLDFTSAMSGGEATMELERQTQRRPAPTRGPIIPVIKRKDPAQIRLEIPQRLKHRIPMPQHPKRAEGGRFFSADSKAELLEDGEISDEERADVHIKLSRVMEMKALSIDEAEQRFLQDINNYVEDELVPGNNYLGPCIRRWIRKRRDWLQDETMRGYLEAFLKEAQRQDRIDDGFFETCMQAAAEAGEGDSLFGNATSEPMHKKVHRQHGQCKCGDSVEPGRKSATCTDPVSLQMKNNVCPLVLTNSKTDMPISRPSHQMC
jgi:hypothetical protein